MIGMVFGDRPVLEIALPRFPEVSPADLALAAVQQDPPDATVHIEIPASHCPDEHEVAPTLADIRFSKERRRQVLRTKG